MLKTAINMSLRQLVLLRSLSTSRCLFKPQLSAAYKSPELWEKRFSCNLLGSDTELIKTINNKITSGLELSNFEIDVFINIAQARKGDTAQIQEAVSNLRKFRKTINAHTQIPSTSHALCRLFLDSERLESLINLLDRRIEYGIFPDRFALNLLFDKAIELENYSIGARLASLIMLQEEFGVSQLNDNFALYSLGKYIESKTDFSDWTRGLSVDDDPIFAEFDELSLDDVTRRAEDDGSAKKEELEKASSGGGDDDEEDEDDAEYIRIPFLRNPYSDNHFDLTNPRLICGKSLSMLGVQFTNFSTGDGGDSKSLGAKCKLVGDILQGNWSEAQTMLSNCVKLNLTSSSTLNEALKYYIENLHDISTNLDPKQCESLLSSVDKLPINGKSLSDEADIRHESLKDLENQEVEQFKADISEWSRIRNVVKKEKEDIEMKKRLIEEIRNKKKELKEREEFLYFFDNLKKKSLTRIEYD